MTTSNTPRTRIKKLTCKRMNEKDVRKRVQFFGFQFLLRVILHILRTHTCINDAEVNEFD